MVHNRVVKDLKKWLAQFSDGDEVWAYEGEVQGIVVRHEEKTYVFHNTLEFIKIDSPAMLSYPQAAFPRRDGYIEKKGRIRG